LVLAAFALPVQAGSAVVAPMAGAQAQADEPSLALPELDAVVEIAGIAALEDYAAVTTLMAEVPGVRRVGLEEAAGDRAVFRVLVRGGAPALAAVLDTNGALVRVPGPPARLSYQYGR
jgi:hypothetical protein